MRRPVGVPRFLLLGGAPAQLALSVECAERASNALEGCVAGGGCDGGPGIRGESSEDESLAQPIRTTRSSYVTFSCPDLTAFTHLDDLGLGRPATVRAVLTELLDMAEGRSKQAFVSWLTDRNQDRRAGEVVAVDGLTGFKTAAPRNSPTPSR